MNPDHWVRTPAGKHSLALAFSPLQPSPHPPPKGLHMEYVHMNERAVSLRPRNLVLCLSVGLFVCLTTRPARSPEFRLASPYVPFPSRQRGKEDDKEPGWHIPSLNDHVHARATFWKRSPCTTTVSSLLFGRRRHHCILKVDRLVCNGSAMLTNATLVTIGRASRRRPVCGRK